jgi:hypothetical protein
MGEPGRRGCRLKMIKGHPSRWPFCFDASFEVDLNQSASSSIRSRALSNSLRPQGFA